MITEAFLWIVATFVELVASLMPDLPDPAGTLGSADSAWTQLAGYMSGAAGWFPFGFAAACVGVVAVMALAAGGVKLVRMVASFLTGGGGSSA